MIIFNLRKKHWIRVKPQICFPGLKFVFSRTWPRSIMILERGYVFIFFDFYISHTNLWFHLQEVVLKKWFFHHFFCVYALLITMTKTETRDFVFIFLGNGLINNLIIVNYSEFIQLTMKFHLLLSTKIPGWLACCHKYNKNIILYSIWKSFE